MVVKISKTNDDHELLCQMVCLGHRDLINESMSDACFIKMNVRWYLEWYISTDDATRPSLFEIMACFLLLPVGAKPLIEAMQAYRYFS